MAIINGDTIARKTMAEMKAHPTNSEKAQLNVKVPKSIIDSLETLCVHEKQSKQDIVALALFDYISANGYLGKKIGLIDA